MSSLDQLEDFIQGQYDRFCTMGRSQKSKKPRTQDSDSPASSADSSPVTAPQTRCCSDVSEILTSIDQKFTTLDARVAIIEALHREFQHLRHSLEFTQSQIEKITQENKALQRSVSTIASDLASVHSQLATVTAENKLFKENILDLQSRSMRDNLVFSGIPETPTDEPEKLVKDFMLRKLKLPPDTVNNITFHRVHRMGQKQAHSTRPRPIVAKFEHFKQKELVQRQGRQLKGTDYGLNDQFPPEIIRRRKVLLSIRKQKISEGKRAALAVDKLYIDGQLFRDKDITPWLF